jgi:hypothetical protein
MIWRMSLRVGSFEHRSGSATETGVMPRGWRSWIMCSWIIRSRARRSRRSMRTIACRAQRKEVLENGSPRVLVVVVRFGPPFVAENAEVSVEVRQGPLFTRRFSNPHERQCSSNWAVSLELAHRPPILCTVSARDGASDAPNACHCGGAGAPCPACNRCDDEHPPKLPDGHRTICNPRRPGSLEAFATARRVRA